MWSQMQLSRRVWFCGCCRRVARGVAGTVVGLRYVVVAVAMPRAVSWSLLSRRVVLSSRSRHVWCRGHGHRAVCCGCCRGGCCRAALCRGRFRHAACGVTVAVVVPCGAVVTVAPRVASRSRSSRRGVTVVVAVVVPLVPQPRSSSWWHCRHDRWLHRGRPWRGRTATHPSARMVVRAQ